MKTLLPVVFAIGSFACASSAPPGGNEPTGSTGAEPVMCTQEAKMCPDGSAVGRTGPKCEFPACPGGDGPVPTPTASPTAEPIPPG